MAAEFKRVKEIFLSPHRPGPEHFPLLHRARAL
jgi:hypothetical protein